jgi:hypothetical protein
MYATGRDPSLGDKMKDAVGVLLLPVHPRWRSSQQDQQCCFECLFIKLLTASVAATIWCNTLGMQM